MKKNTTQIIVVIVVFVLALAIIEARKKGKVSNIMLVTRKSKIR